MKIVFLFVIFLSLTAEAKNTGYLLTRYVAKEYCSCRFVVKQTPATCRNENKVTNLLFRLSEDSNNKVITVSNLFTKTEARFISEEQGCLLEKE